MYYICDGMEMCMSAVVQGASSVYWTNTQQDQHNFIDSHNFHR